MIDKKLVFNIVLGIALVFAIISCFTFFMEFITTIQLKDIQFDSSTSLLSWGNSFVGLLVGYGIPMILSILALVFLFVSHFKQNDKLKKAAFALIGVTALAMLILSIFAWFVIGTYLRVDNVSVSFIYTLMYGLKAHAITAAASFGILFACLLIHHKQKQKNINNIENN